MCIRSSFNDIGVQDLVNFLKDVQMFLDRLNHEDISDDCREIKHSLACRIEFYTKKSKADTKRHSLDVENHRQSIRSDNKILNQGIKEPATRMDTTNEDSYGDTDRDNITTDSEEYSLQSAVMQPFSPDSSPVKTSTPRKMRTSGISHQSNLNDTWSSFMEEDEEDDEEYDLIDVSGKKFLTVLDISSRSLSQVADHKGWLWKKESMFRSVRYWVLVHESFLYLFSDVKDEVYKERFNLENATLKRHKKGVKFIVVVSGTYKNRNSKQEYQTESCQQTDIWISHLENAISSAGIRKSKPSLEGKSKVL